MYANDPQSTGLQKVRLINATINERKCSNSRKRDHGRCWPDWMGYGSCKEQLQERFKFYIEDKTIKLNGDGIQSLTQDKFCIIIDEEKCGKGCIVPEYCEKKQKLL